MPAIKRVNHTQIFSQLNAKTWEHGENNDCSVKAVAIVCGVSYDAAKTALAARGRKDGKGAYTQDILAVCRTEFGKETTLVDMKKVVATYPSPHCNVLKGITTHHPRRFNKVWPKGNYLMFVTRHVAAVVDGVTHDWTVNKAMKVVALYEVK